MKSFKLECEISSFGIDHKPVGKEIAEIRSSMGVVSLGVDEFIEKIGSGYTFVPCRWGKDNCTHQGVQTVVFDIDGSDMGLDEFVEKLNDRPSIWYNTFSSGNVIKFRLVYVFDRLFPSVSYNKLYYWLLNRNDVLLKVDNDTHNSVPWQPVFGTSHEVHGSGIIYEVPDFIQEYAPGECGGVESGKKDRPGNDYARQFWDDYKGMRLYDFYMKYRDVYGDVVIRETIYLPDDEDERIMYPIGPYYCIPVPWRNKNVYAKWKDGENRHGMLYIAGVKFRILYKQMNGGDLDREFLTYLLIRELVLYYDNTDKKFVKFPMKGDKVAIMSLVDNVMKAPLNLLEDKGGKKYKINISYCKEFDIPTRGLNAIIRNEMSAKKRAALQRAKYIEYDKYYDPALSLRENVENMKAHGINNVNLPAIQRYLKSKKIDN